MFSRILVTSFLTFVALTAAAPRTGPNASKLVRSSTGAAVEDSYIVVMKDGASVDATIQSLNDAVIPLGDLKQVQDPCRTRLTVINAFAATLTGSALQHILDDPNVDYVQENAIHTVEGIDQQVPLGAQEPFGDFEVDDEALYEGVPLDSELDNVTPKRYSGGGVDIYILDTGVRVSHRAFSGRARWGATFIGTPGIDYHGHGTHVAGTAAGVEHGRAFKSSVIAVKVLGDKGPGTSASSICGVDFATREARRTRRPSIVNMSLGSGVDRALDTAVRNSIQSGLPYVVAAGNDHADASTHSPARVFEAITVGSINATKYKAWSSNYGSSVNIWFRGVDVTSSDHSSDTATSIKSGTSMATPGVTGILACMLGYHGAPIVPQVLKRALLRHAINDAKGLGKGNTTARAVPFSTL